MRKDGTRVKRADLLYTVVPYVMSKRVDSMNMITIDIPVEPLNHYINEKRKQGQAVSTMALSKKPTYFFKLTPTGLTQTHDEKHYRKSYTIIMDDVLEHIDDPCREGQLRLVKRFYKAWVYFHHRFNCRYERMIRRAGGHISWEERKPMLAGMRRWYFRSRHPVNYLKRHFPKIFGAPKTK